MHTFAVAAQTKSLSTGPFDRLSGLRRPSRRFLPLPRRGAPAVPLCTLFFKSVAFPDLGISNQMSERSCCGFISKFGTFCLHSFSLFMFFDLVQADYGWLTQELIANGSRSPNNDNSGKHEGSLRVVSLLEGGYSLAPLQPPDAAPEKRGRAATAAAAAAAGKKSAVSTSATAVSQMAAITAGGQEGGAAAAAVAGDCLPTDGGLVRGVLSHVRALAETS